MHFLTSILHRLEQCLTSSFSSQEKKSGSFLSPEESKTQQSAVKRFETIGSDLSSSSCPPLSKKTIDQKMNEEFKRYYETIRNTLPPRE